jgi:hypothetical protein
MMKSFFTSENEYDEMNEIIVETLPQSEGYVVYLKMSSGVKTKKIIIN